MKPKHPAARTAEHSILRRPVLTIGATVWVVAWLLLALGQQPRAASTQADLWSTPDLALYRALIDTYREWRTARAVDGVLDFDADAIRRIIDTVRDRTTDGTGINADADAHARLFRAAAMLHIDAADHLWSVGRQLSAATQIEMASRWVDLGARDPEPVGSFRRRWYLGVGLMVFEHSGSEAALDFVDRACEALPDDVPLLTTAAWLNEQLALAPVILNGARVTGVRGVRTRKRDALMAAARRARAALAQQPDATEATLRLARVRMLLEDLESARELLLQLIARTDVPAPHAYVARLLLGRLYVETDEHARAEQLFREAADMIVGGQAARVALGQLLHARGNRRDSSAALVPILSAEPGGPIDPWVDYLMGTGMGPKLRAALRTESRQ